MPPRSRLDAFRNVVMRESSETALEAAKEDAASGAPAHGPTPPSRFASSARLWRSVVEAARLAAPQLASAGSGGCIGSPEAALHTREKREDAHHPHSHRQPVASHVARGRPHVAISTARVRSASHAGHADRRCPTTSRVILPRRDAAAAMEAAARIAR